MRAWKPLVSLILIVKNGMPYLPQAVDSVASQSYRHVELIVQDGGSTDGTLEFLDGFTGIPNMHVQSAPDRGVGQAWNRALRRCSGDIVGSVDADNLLERDAVTLAVETLERYPGCAAIYGDCKVIDSEGRTIALDRHAPFDLLRLLRCELVPPFQSAFFVRRLCGEHLYVDETLRTCADFDLWLRISHFQIMSTRATLSSMRISAASRTRQAEQYDQFCQDKIAALERYLSRFDPSPLIESIRRESIAGIYIWAAKSVRGLEGASERFGRYYERATALAPQSEQLERLQLRVAKDRAGRTRIAVAKQLARLVRDLVTGPRNGRRRPSPERCTDL